MHCTHACNLNCQSCSHYSNHHHGGAVPVEVAEQEIQLWNNRILPRRFAVLGGEPSLHPQLAEFVKMAIRSWPKSEIGVTSNGFGLSKHKKLWEVMSGQNANLTISKHSEDPSYLEKFNENMRVIEILCSKHQVPLRVLNSVGSWRNQYFGYGHTMMPYQEGDSRTSWKNCRAKRCHTLFEGKIWKCPPLAFLKLQKKKFNLHQIWDQYLLYEKEGALYSSATDQEIKDWLSREDETYCSMCPKNPKILDLPNPLLPIIDLAKPSEVDSPGPGTGNKTYSIPEGIKHL